jgi:hypothetical protein
MHVKGLTMIICMFSYARSMLQAWLEKHWTSLSIFKNLVGHPNPTPKEWQKPREQICVF